MDAAGKDGTEGDPQENTGTPQSAAHSTPDGAETGNVQKLNQENTPSRHDHIVNAVLHGYRGRLPVIRAEGLGYKSAIDKVSGNEKRQTYEETYHTLPSLDFSDSNFVGAHQMARSKAVGASLLYMLIVLPIAVKVNKIIYSLSNILSYMSKRFGQ